MKTYTSEDIEIALQNIGIERGDVVNIHSSIFSLGRFLPNTKNKNIAEAIISVILEYLGEEGTLVAPAFNFDFCKGENFDRKKSPSKNMGVLSEAIRNWKGAKRSSHPMQSVAAIGKFAEDICGRDTSSAFSIGGSFDRMLELNTKLLLYGVSFNGASFVHYVEERLEIPYRYWKNFQGTWIDENIMEKREYQMFVRDWDLAPELDIRVLQLKMKELNKLREASLGAGTISSCLYSDLYKVGLTTLEEDPLFLLRNRDEVQERIKTKAS